MALKDVLKKFPLMQAMNAKWKAFRVRYRYRRTVNYYENKDYNVDLCYCQSTHSKPPLHVLSENESSLNIFFLGTDKLQDYGGMIQALEEYGNVHVFKQENGTYGQLCSGSKSDIETNSSRLLEMFQSHDQQNQTPDVLIAQTLAKYIKPSVLGKIKNKYGPSIINIAMDDRHQYWRGTYELIPYLDVAATAAPEAVDWYLKEGCPSIFLPEASSPDIYDYDFSGEKVHDVSFVGKKYGLRGRLVEALRNEGVEVEAYGNGWTNGRIPTSEVPQLFAESRIVLGVGTIGHCSDLYALKMRDFDGPMSGSFYLTHDNPDLYQLYEVGEDIETYTSIEDCVRKVQYYLKHEDERERIAARGHERAKAEHTWQNRFNKLLNFLVEIS